MPQMAPINWILIMILMITIIFLISSLLYFSNFVKPNYKFNNSMIKTNWKW